MTEKEGIVSGTEKPDPVVWEIALTVKRARERAAKLRDRVGVVLNITSLILIGYAIMAVTGVAEYPRIATHPTLLPVGGAWLGANIVAVLVLHARVAWLDRRLNSMVHRPTTGDDR